MKRNAPIPGLSLGRVKRRKEKGPESFREEGEGQTVKSGGKSNFLNDRVSP